MLSLLLASQLIKTTSLFPSVHWESSELKAGPAWDWPPPTNPLTPAVTISHTAALMLVVRSRLPFFPPPLLLWSLLSAELQFRCALTVSTLQSTKLNVYGDASTSFHLCWRRKKKHFFVGREISGRVWPGKMQNLHFFKVFYCYRVSFFFHFNALFYPLHGSSKESSFARYLRITDKEHFVVEKNNFQKCK